MDITAPETASLVLFTQDEREALAGGRGPQAAIVLAANALTVTVKVFTEGADAVVRGVRHVSVALPHHASWRWPELSMFSNT